LLHTRVLVAGLKRLVAASVRGSGPVLLSNPCIHTNEDINEALRACARMRGFLRAPVPLRVAARVAKAWPGFPAREPPGPLAALAALAVDLELDWREAFAGLGLSETDLQVSEITID
jgi:hypothetical protein